MFKQPKVILITQRISSVTNAFVNGIMPVISPSIEEVNEILNILGMSRSNMHCAYCKGEYETWDHFMPLVSNKEPTGYISEIYNLIPSCNTCNSSKGAREWRTWIESEAKKSPKGRKRYDSLLVQKIEDYDTFTKEKRRRIELSELKKLSGWKKHEENRKKLEQEMRDAQKDSDTLKNEILNHIMK